MQMKGQFYINGQWVNPSRENTWAVIDPSTEEPCAFINLASEEDVDAAVAAAKAALPSWRGTPVSERKAYVERILELFERRRGEMAEAISKEMGAPIDLAYGEQAGSLAWHGRNFLEAIDRIEWSIPQGEDGDTIIVKEPIGVVGLIIPWNWPMNQLALKVFPAMLAGCTCVLKPSEEAPLSSMLFAELVHEAGVPAGVFNLVNGDGTTAGRRLSTHPDVEMISFTGSTRAGREVLKAAADTFKLVTLELGGKGANVIFADAGRKAVETGVVHMMENSGQSCNAPSRMLVERPFYDEAVSIAAEVANATRVGPASEKGDHIGPVVNKRQWENIQRLIQKGIEEGARLVAGGPGLPDGFNRGYYVRPTVFADVRPGMTIEREEIFGPVLSIIPFDTEEEAIRIANATPYGLANYVESADPERRRRVARHLRAGMVHINHKSFAPGTFFGGVKASGRAREGGVWGIEEFLETRAISGWKDRAETLRVGETPALPSSFRVLSC
jgi:NAD-dependent aldehyde dehydrogenases